MGQMQLPAIRGEIACKKSDYEINKLGPRTRCIKLGKN